MIAVREATAADFPTIRKLAYAIWPEAYGAILSKEQIDYMLDAFYSIDNIAACVAKEQLFLLAMEQEECLGFISYEHYYQGRSETRIHKIYILTQTQGKGIGQRLISEVESMARQVHSEALSLNVNRFNKAKSFYLKLGFEITGEVDIEIGNGYLMEDYTMEKKIM